MNNNLGGVSISAVIPVRNAENYIETSFEQVTNNLEQNDEAIYVVNGSSDDTFRKISKLAKSDKRVRIVQVGNIGLINALNVGIGEAQNSWIARFDVDDLYSSDRLQKQRKEITRATVAIFSDYSVVGKDLRKLGLIPSGVNNLPTMVSLYGANRTPHPCSLFSREAFIEAGMYKVEDFAAEDLGLWLRMTRTGEFRSVPSPLFQYRLHSNSTMSVNRKLSITNKNRLLTNIGIPRHILDEAYLKTDEVIANYTYETLKEERSFLFLLNLNQALKYTNGSLYQRNLIGFYAISRLLRPQGLKAASNLTREMRKRKVYRSSLYITD
jgi:glycosyltransferase involved in cell wall biosynthesis